MSVSLLLMVYSGAFDASIIYFDIQSITRHLIVSLICNIYKMMPIFNMIFHQAIRRNDILAMSRVTDGHTELDACRVFRLFIRRFHFKLLPS